MVLMIDNYDSFTFNIAQYLIELGENVTVIPNNSDIASVKAMQPTSLVLSPGPCTPSESGISMPMIGEFSGAIPILGICLGHQCIAQFFGGTISQSQDIMHGKTSLIYHTGTGVFANIKNPFRAMRYHSLVLPFDKLPDCLEVTAWTQNPDGTQAEIMGIRHKSLDIEGIQFHPESVLSECGHALLRNFLKPKSPP